MSKYRICNTHAPLPHNEYICHGTGERRQNILNELKEILDKFDDRPCIIPEIRPNNKVRPIMTYPGYVDKRHPAFTPPERPLITHTGVQEIRLTSDPGRVADDPPNVCYKIMQSQQRRPSPGDNKKAVELRGGVVHDICECVKRNGLQDQCPRRECGGRPECLAVNPGPCCPPALALSNKNIGTTFASEPNRVERNNYRQGADVSCCCCHQ